MAIIALTSLAGAPGVTTAATALAVHWPRPVLLLEADTSAVSTLMAGFFRSNLRTTDGGIEKLAFALARNALDTEDLLDGDYQIAIPVHDLPPIPDMPIPSIPDGHKLWVIPGFVNYAIVDGVRGLWNKLPRLLKRSRRRRHRRHHRPRPPGRRRPSSASSRRCDWVLVTASSSMIDLNRAYRRLELPDINQRARAFAGDRYWTLLTSPAAEAVSTKEFGTHVLPVVSTLPHDPDGAAVFSHGRPDPKPNKNAYRRASEVSPRISGCCAPRSEERQLMTDQPDIEIATRPFLGDMLSPSSIAATPAQPAPTSGNHHLLAAMTGGRPPLHLVDDTDSEQLEQAYANSVDLAAAFPTGTEPDEEKLRARSRRRETGRHPRRRIPAGGLEHRQAAHSRAHRG